jgi:Animal haem peroxidase
MPIRSTHNMLDRRGAARVVGSQSRYTYLFPDLAAADLVGCFQGATPRQTWERLCAFEIATRVPLTDLPVMQMRLPPSYTYFGQFVNHDISAPTGDVMDQEGVSAPMGVVGAVDPPGLDRSKRSDVATILENFANEHPEPLTLASLYGDGPSSADPGIRALYEADGKRFRLGRTRREPDKVFADLLIDPASVVHATGAPDIPRGDGVPLIADERNDENLIISQLHLALMLFHNKAVAVLEPQIADPAACFAAARELVTWHYHWLILNDYLPQLLSPALKRPLSRYASHLTEANRVPLEFTTAAFRFGHSMVSAAYDFNANFGLNGRIEPDGALLEELFAFTSKRNMGQRAPNLPELPDHWVIDWGRMTRVLPGTQTTPPREFGRAERIDMAFAPDMLNLVGDSDVAVHGSILFRNLMRGYHRRMPFGQELAARYGVAPLTEADVRNALPQEKALSPGQKGLRQTAQDLGLLKETPAWLYFLCESHIRENGERVGATASHIIADTIVGLLRLNPASLLNQPGKAWHPRQSPLTTPGAEGLTTIRKFLLFAVKDTAAG